jgi:hypothetical protein
MPLSPEAERERRKRRAAEGSEKGPRKNMIDPTVTDADLTTPEVLARLTDLASRGTPLQLILKALGLTHQAFERLCKEHPPFRIAYEEGRAAEEFSYLQSLQAAARDPSNKTSAVAAMFLLKTRFRYVDNHRPTAPSINITLPALGAQPQTREEYLAALKSANADRAALPAPEADA